MKKEFYKPISYFLTAAMLLGAALPSAPAAAKKKAAKLSTKKSVFKSGRNKLLKLRTLPKKQNGL